MFIRTDLAWEAHFSEEKSAEGIKVRERTENGIEITDITVESDTAAERLSKEKGRYITAHIGNISDGLAEAYGAAEVLAEELSRLLPDFSRALFIGVGNPELTADALGPKTANGILATRHIERKFASEIGLDGLKSVAVLSTGVLGKTGMETFEIIKAVCDTVKPDVVITVDALAAADNANIGNTVQICDCGISPGSGVGNRRREISRRTLGVNVIAVGVPTVADFSHVREGLIVTTRDIDLLTKRAAELLSHAINFALQPDIEREVLLSLV